MTDGQKETPQRQTCAQVRTPTCIRAGPLKPLVSIGNHSSRRRESRRGRSPLVACEGICVRGPHPALDIHLLSDHLSVTFPRHSPAWSPQVLHHGADMHCWRVTGFWRGPRAPGQPRQVFPYMMSDMTRNGAEALSRL